MNLQSWNPLCWANGHPFHPRPSGGRHFCTRRFCKAWVATALGRRLP